MVSSTGKSCCSIVIRAFNEEKHIGRLFSGISQQNLRDIEVILIDSGSTDATIAIVSSADWHFPVRIVHIEPEQFSFGRSLNLGIARTQCELVVIASAHVYPVYPDWLESLIAPFEDPQVALSYGKQRGNSKTHFSEHQVLARWYPDNSQSRQTNPFCNNANAAIRRRLWEEHQYDETLSGLEDLEWANWAMKQGYSIAYSAEAEIVHVHEDSPGGIYNRYRREAMAFKRIYPQEEFNLWDFLRLFSGNAFSDVSQAIKINKVMGNTGRILWFRFMQFWGTYMGYRQSGPLTKDLRRTFYYPTGSSRRAGEQPRDVEPIQYHDVS
jgi:glycosyltransferase involved in cell wall biosynthesis